MMTTEEVNKQFGELKLRFLSYYKYCFYFGAGLGHYSIRTFLGGNAEDIYRLKVNVNEPIYFGRVEDWISVTVKHDSEQVFHFSD